MCPKTTSPRPFDAPPPEITSSSTVPSTLPLLDELGNPPENLTTLHETLDNLGGGRGRVSGRSPFPALRHGQAARRSGAHPPAFSAGRLAGPFQLDARLGPDFQHAPQLAPAAVAQALPNTRERRRPRLCARRRGARHTSTRHQQALSGRARRRRQEIDVRTAWIIDDKLNERDFWAAAEECAIYGR